MSHHRFFPQFHLQADGHVSEGTTGRVFAGQCFHLRNRFLRSFLRGSKHRARTHSHRTAWPWLILILSLAGLTGCTTVQPWEKGNLSDYTMRPDRDPLANSLGDHLFFSREATTGGRGVGGGGCGCN